jgi:GT2 family glycosyltransferase
MQRQGTGLDVSSAPFRPKTEAIARVVTSTESEDAAENSSDHHTQPAADTVAVILNWRGQAETIVAAQSCRRTCPECQVLIVDNESTEKSFNELTTPFTEDASVHVLPVDENRGFGAGHNVALHWIKDKLPQVRFVYLLNSDAVASQGAIQSAVQTLRTKSKFGAVGSILLDWDGDQDAATDHTRVQSAGGRFSPWLGTTHQYSKSVEDGRIDYVTFAAVALRIDAMFEIGLFDEQFFMYWEDADVCLRLQSSGWKLAMCPYSHVFHVGGASGKSAGSSKILSYYVWSSLLFRDRARGLWKLSIPLKSLYMMVRGIILRRRWEVLGVRDGYMLYKQRSSEPGYVRIRLDDATRAI